MSLDGTTLDGPEGGGAILVGGTFSDGAEGGGATRLGGVFSLGISLIGSPSAAS